MSLRMVLYAQISFLIIFSHLYFYFGYICYILYITNYLSLYSIANTFLIYVLIYFKLF